MRGQLARGEGQHSQSSLAYNFRPELIFNQSCPTSILAHSGSLERRLGRAAMALPSVLSRDELSRILSQVEPAQQTDAQTEVRGAQTSTRNALVPSFRFGWDARAARAGPSGPERAARDLKWGGCSALGAVRTVETPKNGAGGRVSARCWQSLLVGAVTGGQAAPCAPPSARHGTRQPV